MNLKTLVKSAAAAALFFSAPVLAQDAGTPSMPPPPQPAPQEIKKVVDYYMNGKDGGPILVEVKPCLKVDADKASPTFNDCVEPVNGDVQKGKSVSAWMMWFVPKGAKFDDMSVQISLDGAVRETKDFSISDSMRTRSYKSIMLSKAGKWTFKVMRGTTEFGKFDVNVK
ncbi:MAG: hypothetical protein ACJ790_11420 [Myxococcaceae bacterium]